jgi:hypothetical protein
MAKKYYVLRRTDKRPFPNEHESNNGYVYLTEEDRYTNTIDGAMFFTSHHEAIKFCIEWSRRGGSITGGDQLRIVEVEQYTPPTQPIWREV